MPKRRKHGIRKAYMVPRPTPRLLPGQMILLRRKKWEVGHAFDDPTFGIVYHLFRWATVDVRQRGKIIEQREVLVSRYMHEAQIMAGKPKFLHAE